MEEPLLGPEVQSPPRFIVLRTVSALLRLVPGLALCLYVCLCPSDSLHPDYKAWFTWCSALLILVGIVDLAAVVLYKTQCCKSLHPFVGMSSTCVGCVLPIPLIVLFVFGVQTAHRTEGYSCEYTIEVITLVLLGMLLMISVLCTWKKVCFMCVACCNICGTVKEEGEQKP